MINCCYALNCLQTAIDSCVCLAYAVAVHQMLLLDSFLLRKRSPSRNRCSKHFFCLSLLSNSSLRFGKHSYCTLGCYGMLLMRGEFRALPVCWKGGFQKALSVCGANRHNMRRSAKKVAAASCRRLIKIAFGRHPKNGMPCAGVFVRLCRSNFAE
jgi:hypothetical protein